MAEDAPIKVKSTWHDAAGFTVGDLTMVRSELVIGFVVAGFADAVIPVSWWKHLFFSGHGLFSIVENVLLGPLISFVSFVCSVGNVPLSAALWSSGISFGGTISFIFADLLTLPLVLIYRKYYGMKLTLKLVAVFWAAMSLSGLLTQGIFNLFKIAPTHHALIVHSSRFGNNFTTWMNGIALIVLVGVIWLYRNRDQGVSSPYAKDPICGMQVEKATAAAVWDYEGVRYYFCAPGCMESFKSALAK